MGTKFRDYYEILGVDRNATDQEIKSAYRKLARKYHPDLHSGSDKKAAEEKFKEINEANEVLSNREKRAKYDRLGSGYHHGQEWQPPPDMDGSTFYTWNSGDGGATFSSGFGTSGFSDFFETLFGGMGFREARQPRQRDMESELTLSLEEAYHGGGKMILLNTGDGNERTLEVKIPPGVKDGSKIRLRGLGGKGPRGEAQGNLLLTIRLADHPQLTLQENDVETTSTITPAQAVLGDKINVPTLDGPVLLTIPPMAHSNQKLRLRGKGWPLIDGGRGDQHVKIMIDIPSQISEAEKNLYQKLAELKTGV